MRHRFNFFCFPMLTRHDFHPCDVINKTTKVRVLVLVVLALVLIQGQEDKNKTYSLTSLMLDGGGSIIILRDQLFRRRFVLSECFFKLLPCRFIVVVFRISSSSQHVDGNGSQQVTNDNADKQDGHASRGHVTERDHLCVTEFRIADADFCPNVVVEGVCDVSRLALANPTPRLLVSAAAFRLRCCI